MPTANWWSQPKQKKPKKWQDKWEEETKDAKGKPKDQEAYAVGYDGKRIPLPSEPGPTSSSSSSTSDSLVDELKGMIRQLAHGVPLTPGQMGVLEEDPRVTLAKQQKQINLQRKNLNKERGLETRLRTNEESYVSWETSQKALLRSEKERFEQEQQRMEKELNMLRHPTVEQEEEMSEQEDAPRPDPSASQVEARLLQAEKMAWDAQQAFLSMQSQLQVTIGQLGQMMGQNYPLPPQPSMPPAAAPSPKMNTAPGGSPQMPKPARVPPAPGSKDVAKSHLKTNLKHKETTKDKDAKAKETPAEVVPVPDKEVVDLVDDQETELL